MLARIFKYIITLVLTSLSIIFIGKTNTFGSSKDGIVGLILSLLLNQVNFVVKIISWLYPGCWGQKDREQCNLWLDDMKLYITLAQMVFSYWLIAKIPVVGDFLEMYIGNVLSYASLMGITASIMFVIGKISRVNIESNTRNKMTIIIATVMKIILGLTGVNQIEWIFGDY